MRRVRKRLVVLAASVALGVAAAGCSSGGSAAPAVSGGSGSGSAGLHKVTAMLAGQIITWATAYVAQGMGYFADEGLDVNLETSSSGAVTANSALVGGDVLVTLSGAGATLAPIEQGAGTRMLFAGTTAIGIQITASKKWLAAHPLPADATIAQKVQALRGATLGIDATGDSIDQFWLFLLKKYGLNPATDVHIVAVHSDDAQVAALGQGSLDLISGSPPMESEAVQAGYGQLYINANTDVPGMGTYPENVASVRASSLTGGDAQYVAAFLRAIQKAATLLRTDPAEAKPILRKVFSAEDDATFNTTFTAMQKIIPASIVLTQQQYTSIQALAAGAGEPDAVGYSDGVVSPSWVASALAGGK
jgi:NitT/TauT family transport system substrate-binding protein